jgi:hypothetical protein
VAEVRGKPETHPAGSKPTRRAYLELGALVLVAAACALVLASFSRSQPPAPRKDFDSRVLDRLRGDRPDLVFIGNSMVYTRFHEDLLNELVRPTKVSLIATSAAQSAIWYAQLKHSVAKAGVPIRRVAIFFRDRELTLPALRATGPFSKNLERWLPEPDPVIRKKLAPPAPGPVQELGFLLAEIAPVERLRRRAASAVELAIARRFASGVEPGLLRRRVNRLFRVDELRDRADDAQPAWDETAPFSEVVASSFLPDMLAVAREHGFELEFVRLRKRRSAEGRPEKPGVPEYLAELREYLRRNGAAYRDLSKNRWEAARLYGSGDHIARAKLKEYTKLFARHERSLFEFSAPRLDRKSGRKRPP